MAQLIGAASALVMPSLWEGFGLPALEAMSCGTPVLSSDRGSLPEVVGDGGLYFDPEDASAIARAAVQLLTDPALASSLADKALARSREFSWDRGAAMAEASFRRAAGQ
jgi:glycosyltransferase involved in cell wall biosynthesis